MANTLRIRRRAVGGAAGAPASLAAAELAYNEVDDTLYYGKGDSAGAATSIPAIAGPGAVVMLSGTQTVTGAKTFSSTVALGSSAAASTPAADDNTTKVATTAFVLGQAASAAPAALGVQAVGVATRFARADHVHAMPTLNAVGAPTASVALNSQKITGLATPAADTDAATKAYVDAMAQGLSWKASVRAATTANIALSGAQTIDTVSIIAGDRVLVKDQSTGADNGIYVAAAGAWTRATDADASAEVPSGTALFVSEGAANGDKSFVLTTNAPITLGTTSLTFSQMTGGGTGEVNTASNVGAAGTGVYDGKSGVDLQFRKINAASTKISVALNGQQIDLDVVPGNITALGTIGTGVWQGTAVALGYGGTGADLSGAADGSIFKKSGTALVAAALHTDYLSNASSIDGGTF